MMNPVKVLGLAGSLRRDAASKAILNTIAVSMPAHAVLAVFDLADIPLYNEDCETDPPASVLALREAIVASDGMVVVSPEYNHGMSGVLKNAIDWVSRPGYASVLVDVNVAIITTSSSPLGGARAQADLHTMFLSTLSRITPGREVAIGNNGKTIVAGRLVDASVLQRTMTLVGALLDEIALMRRGRDPATS